MKYIVQSNHGQALPDDPNDSPLWPPPEKDWYPLGGYQGHNELENAIDSFERHVNLARVIWPARIIDSEGKIYRVYDPERDTRLPGCRWRIIRKNSYYLWEKAGCPINDGKEFWEKAEAELQEHNGVEVNLN